MGPKGGGLSKKAKPQIAWGRERVGQVEAMDVENGCLEALPVPLSCASTANSASESGL
jgi:hypothetical protein